MPLLAFRQVLDMGLRAVDRRRAGILPYSTVGIVVMLTLWMMNRRCKYSDVGSDMGHVAVSESWRRVTYTFPLGTDRHIVLTCTEMHKLFGELSKYYCQVALTRNWDLEFTSEVLNSPLLATMSSELLSQLFEDLRQTVCGTA